MMTRAQIKLWQEGEPRQRDWNGALLLNDGDLGSRTKWAMAIDDLPRYRRIIVRTACFYRGTAESPLGSNRGPLIDDWIRNAGGTPGDAYPDPWCAAFVYMLLTQAGVSCKRTMSAKQCLEQFELVAANDVQPGDLAGWVNDDDTGHVFPVVGFTPEGVAGMEGNSDNRVRLTSRLTKDLQFRRVPSEQYSAIVKDAPLILRATAGTR
jgi:hypothetical protein